MVNSKTSHKTDVSLWCYKWIGLDGCPGIKFMFMFRLVGCAWPNILDRKDTEAMLKIQLDDMMRG